MQDELNGTKTEVPATGKDKKNFNKKFHYQKLNPILKHGMDQMILM